MGFYFDPSPADGAKTTNPASSVTYTWRDKYNSWIIEPPEEVTAGTPNIISEIRPIPIEEFPAGTLWFNPLEEQLYIQTGTDWEPAAAAVGASGGSEVLVQDDQPDDQPIGTLWFNTNPDELTLYVFEGVDWVPAAPPVSIEGIEGNVLLLNSAVDELRDITVSHGQEIADAKSTQYGFATALKHLDDGQHRQDGQIIELEEEIDALAPTFDRGPWEFVQVEPEAGQYALGHEATSEYCMDIYQKCIEDANNDPVAMSQCQRIAADCEKAEEDGVAYLTNQWGGVDVLKIHKLDSNGAEHGFGDWMVGNYVEFFNQDNEGYGLFVINEAPVIANDVATVKVSHVSHEGVPAGTARLKVFEMSTGDPTEYVKKSGSTMTGRLNIFTNEAACLELRAGGSSSSKASVFWIEDASRNQIFNVGQTGNITTKTGYSPSDDRHIAPKKYVDDSRYAPPSFRYVWSGFDHFKPGTLEDCELVKCQAWSNFSAGDTSQFHIHWQDSDGRLLCLPSKGASAGKYGKIYWFDGALPPQDPNKSPSIMPDGRVLKAVSNITNISRADDGTLNSQNRKYFPIYRINLEANVPSFELNQQLIIQFGNVLL